jgi:hypothetical protein
MLPVPHLVKKLAALYETQRFITICLLLLLRSECTYTALSGQFPYLGYGLGLWIFTDLVKIVEPPAHHKWSSEVLNFCF